MYNGELVGIIPYSFFTLLSNYGINLIQESYALGNLRFDMFIKDIVYQVAKFTNRQNFEVMSRDIAMYS